MESLSIAIPIGFSFVAVLALFANDVFPASNALTEHSMLLFFGSLACIAGYFLLPMLFHRDG